MTDEEFVKQKWPSARLITERHRGCTIHAIYIGPRTNGRRRKSHWMSDSESEAWKDAARRIRKEAQ